MVTYYGIMRYLKFPYEMYTGKAFNMVKTKITSCKYEGADVIPKLPRQIWGEILNPENDQPCFIS